MILTTQPHLAAGGDAIARTDDGRVVFITGAAPEETVRVEVTKKTKRFLRARVVEVMTPSTARIAPRCRHHDECGGCSLQHVSYEAQLQSKQVAMTETLTRIGRVDLDHVDVLPPWQSAPYGYRTRVRFSGAPVGFRAPKSRKIVEVAECPVLHPALERFMLAYRGNPGDVTAVWNGERVEETARFTQANDAGNDAMCAHLDAILGTDGFRSALELYGGSGNFTRVVARHAARVTMLEGSDAARDAQVPGHVRVLQRDAAEIPQEPFDLVLVDPPRTGLTPAVVDALPADPQLLLYVSCDVGTFARDLLRLAERGLALASVRLFDLYPQTPHIEVIGTCLPVKHSD